MSLLERLEKKRAEQAAADEAASGRPSDYWPDGKLKPEWMRRAHRGELPAQVQGPQAEPPRRR